VVALDRLWWWLHCKAKASYTGWQEAVPHSWYLAHACMWAGALTDLAALGQAQHVECPQEGGLGSLDGVPPAGAREVVDR
jgi:hypothetical protein